MLIDWSHIKTIADPDNPDDIEWLKEMILTLENDFSERLVELRSFIDEKNNSKLQSLLHQIKGVSANFGLDELKQISTRGEAAAKVTNLSEAIIEGEKIFEVWEKTKVELQKKFINKQ
jgi:HPt (histidine-containing phosphotransfer) domain-containing protein